MIEMFDYRRGLSAIRGELEAALNRVLDSGALILGPETSRFEQEFARYVGARHCIAMSSGTMALYCALKACGIGAGDRVVTVANTCPPTIAAIRLAGGVPVFVDVHPDTLMLDIGRLEEVAAEEVKAIVPVHLWGSAVDMRGLRDWALNAGVAIVEDCAQSLGTEFEGNQVGNLGDIGCFSFYPTKHLGAYGDAGAAVTSDDRLAERLRQIRMYGYRNGISEIEGVNARPSELQGAFLDIKLKSLPEQIERRQEIAARYCSAIADVCELPVVGEGVQHSYHQFVVRTADRSTMTHALETNGVSWGIHYPVPVHKMPAYSRFGSSLPVTERAAREILSVPVHEFLTESEVRTVVQALRAGSA